MKGGKLIFEKPDEEDFEHVTRDATLLRRKTATESDTSL